MNFKKLLILFIFGLAALQTNARHIVGGDITVNRVTRNVGDTPTYQVVITVYRDCYQGGIPMLTDFDPTASIGIHRKVGNSWQLFRARMQPRRFTSGESVLPDDDPCIDLPPNLCVDRNQYIFEVELPLYDDSYLISYQRCCRNETISNIVDPGGTGIAYTYELTSEAQLTINSSPVFKRFPPILICVDRPFFFDHSATDDDGDQLVYEFCNPLAAGGPDVTNALLCTGTTPDPATCLPPFERVTFRQPTYSSDNPLPGRPDFTIDPQTGLITGTPVTQGQYVVGICVKEYRDGILLSTVRRDIQLNVSTCGFPQSRIQFDELEGADQYVRISCGETTVDFINDSPEEFVDAGYYWEFNVNGDIRTSSERDVTFTFPGIGDYQGFMVVNPETQCSDTAFINTRIYPAIDADFSASYDSCIAGPISFDATASTTGADFIQLYEWNFGDEEEGSGDLASYQFEVPGKRDVTLSIRDNNECIDSITKVVDWSPVPQLIVVEPSTFRGCLPANVFFNNLSSPINEEYDITWDFGDGNKSDEISPTHIYEKEGVYSVSVKIVSPLNCEIERTFNSWIRVEEKPTADFTYNPPFPNVFNNSVQFTDQSQGAISWQWNFDGDGSAFEPNPNYTFPDTGFHVIDLVVRHVSGCTDTSSQLIDIRPESNFFMPNAFTPNTDAKNDVFKGTGYIDGISDFEMTIWSRWGEQVFTTNDPLEGWNGRKDNSGNELPNGVYVYLVTYKDPRQAEQKLKGYATLLR